MGFLGCICARTSGLRVSRLKLQSQHLLSCDAPPLRWSCLIISLECIYYSAGRSYLIEVFWHFSASICSMRLWVPGRGQGFAWMLGFLLVRVLGSSQPGAGGKMFGPCNIMVTMFFLVVLFHIQEPNQTLRQLKRRFPQAHGTTKSSNPDPSKKPLVGQWMGWIRLQSPGTSSAVRW